MTDYIYRARVHNGGETVTYHNSNGQTVTYKPGTRGVTEATTTNEYMQKDAAILFNTINKYFTGKSPNITPQEQLSLKADIAKLSKPISGRRFHYPDKLDIYEGINFVLSIFSDKKSDGGENITPKEVYQIYEIFHSWTQSTKLDV